MLKYLTLCQWLALQTQIWYHQTTDSLTDRWFEIYVSDLNISVIYLLQQSMSFVIVRRIIWKLFYALTYINIMVAVHVLICVDITIIVTIHTIREETNYQR